MNDLLCGKTMPLANREILGIILCRSETDVRKNTQLN